MSADARASVHGSPVDALLAEAARLHAEARLADGIAVATEALALARDSGDRRAEAAAHRRLGNLRQSMSAHEEACADYVRSLEICRAAGYDAGAGYALMNLATSRYRLGDVSECFALLGEALQLARAAADPVLEAHVLHNTGTHCTGVGAFERARDLIESALACYRRLGARTFEAGALSNLGGVANSLGDHALAESLLSASLAIRTEIGDRNGRGITMANLGRAILRRGDAARACEVLKEAVDVLAEVGDRSTRWRALNFLADALLPLGRFEEAEAALRRSLALQREVHEADAVAQSLHSRTLLALARGDLDAALGEARATVAAVETFRRALRSADERSGFLAMGRECYEQLVHATMQLAARDPGARHDAAAFEAAERSRARSLLDIVGGAVTSPASGEHDTREADLEGGLQVLLERRFALLAAAAPEGEERQARREIELLAAELDQARDRAGSRRTSLPDAPTATVDVIQREVLDDDVLLLAYSVGDPASYAWAVTRAGTRHVLLPGRDGLTALVRQALASCARRDGDARGPLGELAAVLLAPFSPISQGTVAFVPDDALHAVPFAALPSGTGEPLVASHDVVVLPSASALPVLRRRAAARRAAARGATARAAAPRVAILADPVIDAGDERLPPSPLPERETMGRLPFTGREAEAIASRLPGGQATLLTGLACTRDAAVRVAQEDHDILHVATHGFLDAVRPELSGLVLSRRSADGTPRSGFLSARDVARLRVRPELVVLSGCHTALGREVPGEGIVGLPRAFLIAGATRVLASLWRVDDVATARLMELFYAELLGAEAHAPSAARAIRRAQVELSSQRRFRSPYFWGAFTLMGDWR